MVVVAPRPADEETPQERAGAAFVRTQQRAPDERHAVQLVGPEHRAAEARRRDEHETRDGGRLPKRDLERDAATERVTEEDRALDPELAHNVQHHVRKLRETGVRLSQRRREAEAGELDDMCRVAEGAERASLWCERYGGCAHAGKQDRVRTHRRTAGLDPDPVSRLLHDRFAHLITMYPQRREKGSGRLGLRSSPWWGIRYSRAVSRRFLKPREKGSP